VPEIITASPWPGLALWTVLYIGDYAMTLATARLYRTQSPEKIVFEGSFELTPVFQQDIDALRAVSPRFLVTLFAINLLLWVQWRVTAASASFSHYYLLILGMLIAPQLVIHIRHLRNYFLFATALGEEGLQGRMEYPRVVVLRLSSIEIGTFAGLYCILFLVTGSWFFFGGVITCAVLAWKHRRLAVAHLRGLAQAAERGDAADEGNHPDGLRS